VRQHWPRVLGGFFATLYLLYLGFDGIASRESFSIAAALVSGSIGRSFSYAVYGDLAVVMGTGWISAAVFAFAGFSILPVVPRRGVELTRDLGLLGFSICFVYVAFRTVRQLLFGG
jgi:hypothetical protein